VVRMAFTRKLENLGDTQTASFLADGEPGLWIRCWWSQIL
jgi:hypothetical protein